MTPTHTNKTKDGQIKRYHYYRCTATFKKDWHSCDTKQVNATKFENYIFNTLDRISKDSDYIENLIFRLNNDEKLRGRVGLEISEVSSKYDPKAVENIIKKLVGGLAEGKGTEKNLEAKKYIQEIIYSPDTIQLVLKYKSALLDSSADLSTRVGARRQSQDESPNIKKSLAALPHKSVECDKALSFTALNRMTQDFSQASSCQKFGSAVTNHPKYLNLFVQNIVHGSQEYVPEIMIS